MLEFLTSADTVIFEDAYVFEACVSLEVLDPLPSQYQKLLDLAAGADFWIADSHTAKGWPNQDFLRHFAAYRERRIYHHERRTDFALNAFDWYETGAMRPDLVLEDLVSLFHPEIVPGHELMFFDRLRPEARN